MLILLASTTCKAVQFDRVVAPQLPHQRIRSEEPAGDGETEMRRLLLLGIGAALVAAVPMTHEAMANNGQQAGKVDMCHNTHFATFNPRPCFVSCPGKPDAEGVEGVGVRQGQIINVNRNSVAAHEAHDDRIAPFFGVRPDGSCQFLAFSPCDASCD